MWRHVWILVLVFLAWPTQPIVLRTFADAEACQHARNRIGFQMAEAYPYERDFTIECQLKTRVV